MKKRILSVVCCLAVCLAAFAGCAPSQSQPSSQPASSGADSSASSEPAELRFMWWGGDARHEATLAAIKKYTELNLNVKINGEYGGYDGYYQKVATQLAGNSAPDLIQMDTKWFYDLMRQGDMFVDLGSYSGIDLQSFDEEMIEACKREGKLVGLPTGVIAEEWFITNADFMKKQGLESTKFTWDSLIESGKKIHESDPEEYLLGIGTAHLDPLMRIYLTQKTGKSIVSDKYEINFTAADAEDALSYLLKLFESGTAIPFEESVVTPDISQSVKWQNGKCGMLVDSSSTVTSVVKNSKFSIGQTGIPIAPDARNTGIEIHPAQILSVNKQSKNVDATVKFLTWFLTDPEAAKILKDARGVPANSIARDVLEKENIFDPIVKEITEDSMQVMGETPSDLSSNSELSKITSDIIAKVIYKNITPAEGAEQLLSQFETKLAELKK